MVDDVAQFSMRGGIFDIYSFGMAEPVRLEFWGDEISELRHFDLISQRSTRDADLALILPVDGQLSGDAEESDRVSITALFGPDTIIVIPEDSRVGPELTRTWDEAQHHIDLARRRGEDTPGRSELYTTPEQALASLASLGILELFSGEVIDSHSEFATPDNPPATFEFPIVPPEPIHRDM
jgi:transcription-repair coupling factor (superfamily II helicase)